jgi:hypothetical protein
MCRQDRIKCDGDGAGQADLAAVGMAAQQQIETGVRRLAIDLRRVRQEDGEPVVGNIGRCLFDVVDAIIMRIVDAGQVDRFTVARNGLALVEQHPDSHFFESGNHANGIVVSQHAIDAAVEAGANPRQAFERGIEWPISRTAIVAGQDAHVIGHTGKKLSQSPHRAFAHLHMQIADMEQGQTVESARQCLHSDVIVPDLDLLRVPAAAPMQSR